MKLGNVWEEKGTFLEALRLGLHGEKVLVTEGDRGRQAGCRGEKRLQEVYLGD
jgi:hypothetical protein